MKANKIWSVMMMLVLVLGTAVAFSSCSKDEDDNGGGGAGAANSVTINGKSHKIEECFVEESSKGSDVVFYYNDEEMEGIVAVEFDGEIPSGNVKANEMEVEYGYWNGGADYEGRTTDNVPCNIKVSDGKCTFKASNIKVKIEREDHSESFEATVSVNYSGKYELDY